MLKQLREALSKKEKRIACFVDGPNMLRKELGVNLETIKARLLKQGKLKGAKLGRVYRIKESEIENFLNRNST